MIKNNMRKVLSVGIILFFILLVFQTTAADEIEYPRKDGPYTVFITGKCYGGLIPGPINIEWLLLKEEGYTRAIQVGPLHFYWMYPYGPDYEMEEGSKFYVNGQKQDITYPTVIELMGFKGYAPAVFLWLIKMPFGKIRVVGICEAINLD